MENESYDDPDQRSRPETTLAGWRCKTCASFADAVQSSRNGDEYSFWNYEEAQRARYRCCTCRDIVRALDDGDVAHRRPSSPVGIVRFYQSAGTWSLELVDRTSKDFVLQSEHRLQLLHAGPVPDHARAIGTPVKDDTIEIEKISRWIRQCDGEHAGYCHSLTSPWARLQRASDIRLLDVHMMCLVEPVDEPKYVALSYVWGSALRPFQTTKENVVQLSRPGAFNLPETFANLPQVLRDAIYLTRTLGLGHIWVDRFCIVQDDCLTKHHQIEAMASIYANAYLTIAATERDASSGLYGIQQSYPRSRPFRMFTFGSAVRMLERDPTRAFGSQSRPAEYHTRGWTFQEWTLSRRILVFHHQTVTWKCQKLVQQENGARPYPATVPNLLTRSSGLSHHTWTSWPNLEAYCVNVEEFSGRILRYQDDVFSAFQAMMTVLGRSMYGRMLYGIPEIFFTALLLWSPHRGKHRRKLRRRNGDLKIPSWAWAGWIGKVDLGFAECYFKYIGSAKETWTINHSNTVDMYMSTSVHDHETQNRIRDLHYWQKRHPGAVTSSDVLPSGYHFTQHVPLVELATDTASILTMPLISPRIQFRTQCIVAVPELTWGGFAMADLENHECPFLTSLGGSGDEPAIGYLDIDPEDLGSIQLEVVLISVGCMTVGREWLTACGPEGARYLHRHCETHRSEEGEDDCTKTWHSGCKLGTDWSYRFYNVLWVKKDLNDQTGCVWNRCGVGKVWAEFWDAQFPQEMDMILA
jgi:hypothetical protein